MKFLWLLMVSLLTMLSCHDEMVDPESGNNPDIHASCLVLVNDLNGLPLQGASIKLESNQVSTDANGISFFDHVLLKQRSLMTIEKEGFFTCYHKFGAFEGSTQTEDIVLLPKTPQGSFLNNFGGIINIGNTGSGHEAKFTFPADVAVKEDGSPYEGFVKVLFQPIFADDPLLLQKSQGALLAENQEGQNGILTSFGMFAIELRSSSGDMLKVAVGKEVFFTFEVPGSIRNVPVKAPMWYFDEEKKYWIESGEATKSDKNFIAKLSHFSLWNIATWSPYVILTGTIATPSGTPLSGISLSITLPEHSISTHDRTDDLGKFLAYIPQHEGLRLDILGNCSSTLHTENLQPFSVSTDILVTVNEDLQLSTITGIANNCDSEPVTHAYMILESGTSFTIYTVENANGVFSLPVYGCIGKKADLRLVDKDEGKSSHPLMITLAAQNDLGTINTCDSLSEFLRFTVTGFSPEYLYYFIKFERVVTKTSKSTRIGTLDEIGPNGYMILYANDIVAGNYPNTACTCTVNLPNGEVAGVSDLDLIITEYGGSGQYVRGTFTGLINKGNNGHGGAGASNFAGSFSVKRS